MTRVHCTQAIGLTALVIVILGMMIPSVAHSDFSEPLAENDIRDGGDEAVTAEGDQTTSGFLSIGGGFALSDVGWQAFAVAVLAVTIILTSAFFIAYSVREILRAFK